MCPLSCPKTYLMTYSSSVTGNADSEIRLRWFRNHPYIPLIKETRQGQDVEKEFILAYAEHQELYVGLATIFRRFDFEPQETTREDVDARHDFFVPSPKIRLQGHAGYGDGVIPI